VDIALVDVVVSNPGFIASRAVWDVSTIHEIFLSRAEPGNIGFSSVGAHVCALPANSGKGVHIAIGDGSQKVKAPIAPGLIRWLPIGSCGCSTPRNPSRSPSSPRSSPWTESGS